MRDIHVAVLQRATTRSRQNVTNLPARINPISGGVCVKQAAAAVCYARVRLMRWRMPLTPSSMLAFSLVDRSPFHVRH